MKAEDLVRAGGEENLEVREVPGKGRGIFSRLGFEKNDYVCEYAGELISCKEGEEREARYLLDEQIGSYIYFFRYSEKRFCIDATEESGRHGRLINHSKTTPNLKTKVCRVDDQPRMYFVATVKIEQGDELLYDYGDTRKEAVNDFPWLLS